MQFHAKDVSDVLANKTFIDTVIVPVISIDFSETTMIQSSSAADYITNLTNFIEHQFRGRILLLPPMTYASGIDQTAQLAQMQEKIIAAGFKHVFFMTSEHEIHKLNEQFAVIWLPAIPLESMDNNMKQKILEDQLAKVIPLFTDKWANQN
ncbi:hypothetical protein GCM10007425_09940 [Lysinibacillus alkalisoli]|uniref:DUF2487 family protein n=1 Tax=Lysinibacillus alkalisoli TaxID=1911548 RepID=A0A917G138_9BACI|nr:DUF2487 family protein [Lysinibacillus alkalisoli]GGG17556.1 hypothetical protein GCM10007425_09940 [Lysinibacillus alkalisoli]